VSVKFSREHWLIAAALFVTVGILGALRMAPGVVGVFHDDGIYVATAKALAEGKGYRLIDLPGEPPQTKYPFLYPSVLALLWRLWPVFPNNLVLLQAFSLICASGSVAIAFLYLVRFGYFSKAEAASASLIGATSPVVLYFATQTLSEPLFGLLLICGLWCVESELHRSTRLGRSTSLFHGVTLALPFLTRVVAGPVLAVGSLLVLWRKRNIWLLVGTGCCSSLWVWWVLRHSVALVADGDVGTYYTVTPYISWWSQRMLNPLRVPAWNTVFLLSSTITVPLPAFAAVASHFVWIVLVGGLATWWLIAKGLVNRTVLVGSLAGYTALILLWPWPPARFLVPLVPLVLVFLVKGINRASLFCPGPVRTSLLATLLSAAVLSNLVVLREDIASTRRSGYPRFPGISDPLKWAHFEEMFSWVRLHSSPDDVVASGLDTMLFLYTGRHAVRPFEPRPVDVFYGDSLESGTVEEFVHVLNRYHVRVFVRFPMPGFADDGIDRVLIETMRKFPGCLSAVYSIAADSRFAAFAIDRRFCASTQTTDTLFTAPATLTLLPADAVDMDVDLDPAVPPSRHRPRHSEE